MKFKPIDLSFVIETDLFRLDIQEMETKHFFCKGDTKRITIYCPLGTKYDVGDFQIWFRKVVREALRREAKLIFPNRLKEWSQKTGLKYKQLSVHMTSSKWGSYSSLGNLNLSLYLLLLDSQYIDYTMCHELCHSKEMNHGAHFWQLLNGILDGKARELSREMNKIVRGWYDSGDSRYLLVANK